MQSLTDQTIAESGSHYPQYEQHDQDVARVSQSDKVTGPSIGGMSWGRKEAAEFEESARRFPESSSVPPNARPTSVLKPSTASSPNRLRAPVAPALSFENPLAGEVDYGMDEQEDTTLTEAVPSQEEQGSPEGDGVRCERPGCGKTFGDRWHMQYHVKEVHDWATAERIPCEHPGCKRTFGRPIDMRRHVKDIHEKGLIYCNRGCLRTSIPTTEMEEHIRAVHENTGVHCLECGSRQSNNERLAKHMKLHVPGNFACPRCPAKWALERNLRHHINDRHLS